MFLIRVAPGRPVLLLRQDEASILIQSTLSFGAGAAVLSPGVAPGLAEPLASSIVPAISTLWPTCGAIWSVRRRPDISRCRGHRKLDGFRTRSSRLLPAGAGVRECELRVGFHCTGEPLVGRRLRYGALHAAGHGDLFALDDDGVDL